MTDRLTDERSTLITATGVLAQIVADERKTVQHWQTSCQSVMNQNSELYDQLTEARARADKAETERDNAIRIVREDAGTLNELRQRIQQLEDVDAERLRQLECALRDVDRRRPKRKPDGWIVGRVAAPGELDLRWTDEFSTDFEDACRVLVVAREVSPDNDLRLYEVREVQS